MKSRSYMAAGFAAAALALASGCASVEISSPNALDGVAVKGVDGRLGSHVVVETDGYYFLWTVPLVSGDLRWDERKKSIKGGTRLFCDMVDVASLQNAVQKIAESRNCDIADLSFVDSDTTFAGLSDTGVIGALFGNSHITASAVLVPRGASK